jgi:hypothetical protein
VGNVRGEASRGHLGHFGGSATARLSAGRTTRDALRQDAAAEVGSHRLGHHVLARAYIGKDPWCRRVNGAV